MKAGIRLPRIAVVGAGLSGILMGLKLKEAGFSEFVIYEKNDSVGGTWRDNTYPGLTCDVPSRLFCYSFAPNLLSTKFLPSGDEVRQYLTEIADKSRLNEHLQYKAEITAADWDGCQWTPRSNTGTEGTFDFLITATGFLYHPRNPEIEGLGRFDGDIIVSSRWDERIQLRDRRVGIIGGGSSGTQLASALARNVKNLTLFNRTPQWVFPLPNWSLSAPNRWLMGRSKILDSLTYLAHRWFLEHLFGSATISASWQRSLTNALCELNLRRVRDPELRARLTPTDQPMCKRMVFSNTFYKEIQRSNVEVVTSPIQQVMSDGVEAGGKTYQQDVLILATGFDSHAFMRRIEITGEAGVSLRDAWQNGPRTYRTVAVPQFPNFFMLLGPNSPFGHYPAPAVAETQVAYVVRLIERFAAGDFDALAPSEQAADSFGNSLREAVQGTIWASGCNSWYIDANGSINTYPWSASHFRNLLAEPDLRDFRVHRDGSNEPGSRRTS